ncbi:dolichyl-phosphate-mannose-protein mannosyltransferase [Nematocida major]|uniref:dolichyl-phosphate-mannose-protein mannosyltransferase n=1 Tax=Nematocida major TaxID=1912982 RepID=UPI002008544D|nr:dolichyl-phosphate-mannose-protein mannosyltransferase [Nematocida major]KAH9387157.1 dolichyl-phosphate-mannose-protein mannosyltransferase [Nematocida major]
MERLRKGVIKTLEIGESTPKKTPKKEAAYKWRDFVIIWLLSFLVRVYRIEKGGFVMWDEAHFGKFAGHYLSREFFFDVHPPLGKLLTALSGWLVGMASDFSFNSESAYPSGVDFVGMRIFHALFGAFIPVCGYFAARTMRINRNAAFCAGIWMAFDNAFVAVSRLILLDPFLVLFIGAAEAFLCRVVMDRRRVETISGDLIGLGISIGLAMSVKWVGLLTVAHVGIYAVYMLLVDVRNRDRRVFGLFYRLSVTLILIPVLIYMASFWVHFQVLNKSGPGDGEMSSRFQIHLENSEVLGNDPVLSYGNKITIRSGVHGAGILHSHADRYPTGGQQVTTYPHKDGNNHWRVLKVGDNPTKVRPMENLVLYHTETNGYLAVDDPSKKTHLDPADGQTEEYSIAEGACKVLCMTQEEMDNQILSNTVFQLEPLKDSAIHPLKTHFYIRNTQYNCYLAHTGKKLPKWGHQQGEVVCLPEKTHQSIWNIELNKSEESDNTLQSALPLRPSDFLHSVLELNAAMHSVNNGLVDDGNDVLGSVPVQWIFPKKWLRFNRWDGSVPRFAMVGNVCTWYLGSANILFLVGSFLLGLSKKRPCKNAYMHPKTGRMYIVLGGWLFHYLPFMLVKRILYLHHYLPALFISILGVCMVLEKRRTLVYLYTCAVVLTFVYFSPITYGYMGGIENMPGYRLFKDSWNVYAE